LRPHLIVAPALAALGALAAFQAGATNMFNPVVSPTTVLDGASIAISGTLNDTSNNSQPWVAELFAGAGECMRLFVITTAFDAKITVAAPNGEIFRDDDSGGSFRPLVQIAGAPVSGWYTVQVAQFAGVPTDTSFTMLYGRYDGGNVNCATPTVPLVRAPSAAAEAAKDPAAMTPAAAPRRPEEP
jgi:hypothetical protein